uniref:Hairy and enhancer of split related-7 n=1 Tax=Scleropages formosus TaxID=113540 RepID=A0A8C9S3S7_SCLFO
NKKGKEKTKKKTFSQLLKPQVERRRRERMNRSLETLRMLLFQGPRFQVKKAEILEHTVVFLKNRDQARAGEHRSRQHIQEGFSACLQRAARFLHSRGELKQAQIDQDTKASRWPTGPERRANPAVPARSLHNRVVAPSVQFRCRKPVGTNHRFFHHRSPPARGDPSIPQHLERKVSASSCYPTDRTSQDVWRPWP